MKILRYVVVDDCGTVINPMVVEGQVHGGGAHGVGNALLEEVVYDAVSFGHAGSSRKRFLSR